MAIGDSRVDMQVTELGDTVTKVTLTGRLDASGVKSTETRFVAALVPAGKSAIVDLSGVEFVMSMGIRMFISVARSMRQRQAKLALYNVQPMVNQVFEAVVLSEIIPIVEDEAAAIATVSS